MLYSYNSAKIASFLALDNSSFSLLLFLTVARLFGDNPLLFMNAILSAVIENSDKNSIKSFPEELL